MLTVPFKSLIDGVLHRAGVDPEDVTPADLLALIESISDRYKDAFEYARWTVFYPIEQRWFRDFWAPGTAYDEGDEVYFEDDDAYYVALEAAGADESPTTHPEKWEELSDFRRLIEYEQTGRTAISAVTGAWDRDPLSDAGAVDLVYSVRNEGFAFAPGRTETSVWIEYRARPTNFAAEIFEADEAWTVGDLIYDAETGEVYRVATTTSPGEKPSTTPAKFTLQPFPEFLARAVKIGALADWFTSDERPQAAAIQERKFYDLLDEQVWQFAKLQGQSGRPNVSPA